MDDAIQTGDRQHRVKSTGPELKAMRLPSVWNNRKIEIWVSRFRCFSVLRRRPEDVTKHRLFSCDVGTNELLSQLPCFLGLFFYSFVGL